MEYYIHKFIKKPRSLTASEKAGMANLLTGIKMIREQAITKLPLASGEVGEDTFTIKLIPQ